MKIYNIHDNKLIKEKYMKYKFDKQFDIDTLSKQKYD